MYIATRQQLVEDEQWSRRDYVTLLISTTPGMTIKNGFGDFLVRKFWPREIQRLTQNKTESKLRLWIWE